MNIRRVYIVVSVAIVLMAANKLPAQEEFPKDYFRSPVDIPILLSGNFAELRGAHFHSGIDIKTQGVEGKNIYAAAGGYIYRIRVSPWGYGKVLYVNHPHGYQTVYGHLSGFSPRIEKYVRDVQYKQKSYSVDLFFPPSDFPVEKGEVIGYSGNSGSSMGPHLHFEIRDSRNEHPLNPLFFGFDVLDNIPPRLYNIGIHPLDGKSSVNGQQETLVLPLRKRGGKYEPETAKQITVNGPVGFSIHLNDYLNNTGNRCGAFSIELYVDGKQIYHHELKKFSFYETRYILSLVDQEQKRKSDYRVKLQKSFIDPGNRLSIYKNVVNRGIVHFNDNKEHVIKYVVTDAAGNKSIAQWEVQSVSAAERTAAKKREGFYKVLPWQVPNSIEKDELKLYFPMRTFYDSVYFYLETEKQRVPRAYSPVYKVHNNGTAVHKRYSLSIRPDSLPGRLKSKALIARIDRKDRLEDMNSKWDGDYLTVNVREFGRFCVAVDTTAPKITPWNFMPGADIRYHEELSFKVSDNISGVAYYSGYIDGNWVLFEYDAKSNRVVHKFSDGKVASGKRHKVRIIANDEKGNVDSYETDFYW